MIRTQLSVVAPKAAYEAVVWAYYFNDQKVARREHQLFTEALLHFETCLVHNAQGRVVGEIVSNDQRIVGGILHNCVQLIGEHDELYGGAIRVCSHVENNNSVITGWKVQHDPRDQMAAARMYWRVARLP